MVIRKGHILIVRVTFYTIFKREGVFTGHAVEMFFDKKSEDTIRRYWQTYIMII